MDEEEKTENTPAVYEIRLEGYLDPLWSEWFYEMAVTHESDGITTLHGPLPDQAVLHSVLQRIRDMNLRLIDVHMVNSSGDLESSAPDEDSLASEKDTDESRLHPGDQEEIIKSELDDD